MKLYNRKYLLIAFTMIIGLVFITKLLYMQIIDDKWKIKAEEVTQAQIVIEPARGLILDRKGELLASNQSVYSLMVIPQEVRPLDTLEFCALLGIDKAYFIEKMEDAKSYSHYKASKFINKISKSDFGKITEKLHKYPGFFEVNTPMRFYPRGIGAHVLGDVAEVNPSEMTKDGFYKLGNDIGKGGLEKQYELNLRGQKGVRYMYRNKFNVLQKKTEDTKRISPVIGDELVSTLDANLQAYGEKLMENKRGCIIAIEPKTGEILCMISAPHFDPNTLVGKERGENFVKLKNDTLKPLFNRAVLGQYRPGSIFKMVQALIALQSETITPQTRIRCNRGIIVVMVLTPNDDLEGAIQHSCNPYFREVMRRMVEDNEGEGRFEKAAIGLDLWQDKISKFGFGSNLGIDFPRVMKGNIPRTSYFDSQYGKLRWAYSSIYSLSIGEGENQVTPLQMANLVAIIANKGYYITPHLIRSINGENVFPVNENFNETGVDSVHFNVVQEAMRKVIEVPGGTARRAKTPGYTVCGKTGTVQNDPKGDHSVFMAFAPMQNPEIAIAVYVESAGYGGTWAAPISSLMIEKYLSGEVTQEAKETRILEAILKYNE